MQNYDPNEKNSSSQLHAANSSNSALDAMQYGQASRALRDQFFLNYAPYCVDGYVITPRTPEEMPAPDPSHPEAAALAAETEKRRKDNPMIGAGLAARAIVDNLLKWLRTDRGIHAEGMIAVLGALCGYEISHGIMDALLALGQVNPALLGIMLVDTKDGGRYLMGDLPGNEFMNAYLNAGGSRADAVEKLRPISQLCAATVGSPAYWDTPVSKVVGQDPRALSELFAGKFGPIWNTFTRWPHERAAAYAFAARETVEQCAEVLPRERSLAIFAEYGWRTSHFVR